jgi:hypothetical protein
MSSDWIWMPHAGHLCIAYMCRYHLNTYVNGYIVSTVGEYLPPYDALRILLETRIRYPKLSFDADGNLIRDEIPEDLREKILALKGDAFEGAYLKVFGFEELGLNRTYETMVFKAEKNEDASSQCCPWRASGSCLDMEGYNDAVSAYQGHIELCEKWAKA